ncbi:MAG: hypothetical protein QNJ00_17260 [Woeseiaceae bacterium]|nr:hypothetical protein [Woeseiaceae bacterium]
MKKWTWTKTSFTGLTRVALAMLLSAVVALPANAGPREQAKRIHDRLAGVPPSEAVLNQMVNAINGSEPSCASYGTTGAACAAYIAMDNQSFYNVTLKNFAAPWTNRDQSVFVPFNDYIATVVGMVRDDVPFNTLLSADLTYVGRPGVVGAAPAANNNTHYEQLEANNVNLRDDLVSSTQSSVMGIPANATAGVMTSRAASEAFFVAGTNRAMFRFTLLNHMCNDLEQMKDTTLAPDRIRQDVSRSPGGDSRLFLNNCIGCHTGMDPLAGAFAYYNYNEDTGALEYTPGTVQSKYFNNDLNFPQGFRTTDDNWENYWRRGQNSYLGFDPGLPGQGNGAKSMGQELGNSVAFAACQVKKTFRAVCMRDPESAADHSAVTTITTTFRSSGYRMKQVFADTAVHCMGQ